ncbi:MAG: putative toxin-antitoxin system toxin component, PIN family [Chloroflexota bacterium]|nr:putative toxin-antitoxin system toxin component, PIN family [Chloroflexota bacterium]
MSEPLRAVFDTNLWISYELYRGNPWRCVQAAKAGQVKLFHCTPMIAELADKLRHRFAYPENHIHAVVYEYRQLSTQVVITGTLHVVEADPTDDKFVECALVAGASYLVSGDRHLLALGEYQGISIVTAKAFLATLAS